MNGKAMRILVTGGTGFVGRYLLRELRRRQLDVFLFARPTSDVREAKELGCEIVTGDLRDFNAAAAAVRLASVAVHVGEIGLSIKGATRLNVELVQRLLAAASQASAFRRFVLVSSITVVAPPAFNPADENTPSAVSIRDNYTIYKRACEAAVAASGLPATIVRGTTIYGPGAHYLLWLARWLRRMGRVGLPFPGRLDVQLPCIHVADLARLLAAAALQEKSGLAVYHAADDEGYCLREAVRLLEALLEQTCRLRQPPLWLQRAAAWCVDRALGLFGLPPNAAGILNFLTRDGLYHNAALKHDLVPDLLYPTLRDGLPGTAAWIKEHW